MNKDELEYYLNRGNSFGYNTKNNEAIPGWVMLSKRFPANKFFERFTESDDPYAFNEQSKIRDEPYSLWIAELKKEAYNSEKFPANEDYELNINYTFKTLDDVEFFLKEFQLCLVDLRWTKDFDFF